MNPCVTRVSKRAVFSFFVGLQPMVFGAMMHRDEAFDAIYAQYLQTSTAAATITPETWWLYVWDQRWNHLTLFSSDTFKSEQLLNSFFCCYLKDFWQTLVTFYKTNLKLVFSSVAGPVSLLLRWHVNMFTCCFRVNTFIKWWCCWSLYF